MGYTDDVRYFQYMIESAIEREKINGFLKTITGVNEDVSFSKLDAIHEDVGDKIRNLWDKFIAFLNRVWAKFAENCQKLINSNKGYLEQYKDIILNKKPQSVDIEMRDYPTGIHRMTSTPIQPFNAVKDKVPVDAESINQFQSVVVTDYTDTSKDFLGFVKAWFQGGEDKKSTNLTNLNMTDLYNYCHDYQKIVDIIGKDKDVLANNGKDITAAIEKAKSGTPPTAGAPPKPAEPAAQPANPPKPTTTPPAQPQQQTSPPPTAQQQQTHASFSIDNYMGSYFTEDDTRATFGATDKNAAGNTAATTDTSKASSNMKTVQTSAEPVKTEGEDLEALTGKLRNYDTVCSTVLGAKKEAAEIIYKDYMKIIQLHVGHHVGTDGDGQVAQAGSNHKAALVIDNPQQALDTIAKIEDKNTKDADKSKMTSDLNKQVMGKNPNFQGGLAAIKAAAQAAVAAGAK